MATPPNLNSRRAVSFCALIAVLGACSSLGPADRRSPVVAPATYYISPSGSDAHPGTSPRQPWQTFRRVFNDERILRPGDTLVLMDGVYDRATTGLPDIHPRHAHVGRPGSPITIRAEHERQAWLRGDGSVDTFKMSGMRHWRIEGLYATSGDFEGSTFGSPFVFDRSENLVVRRSIGAFNNRFANSQVFLFMNGKDSLFEENEAYHFNRHGFSIWRSHGVTIRRSYTNSRARPDLPNGRVSHVAVGGDDAIAFYESSSSIAENCVNENLNEGVNVHGGTTFDGQPGGHDNRILGCISLRGIYGAVISSNPGSGVAARNTYRDLVIIDPTSAGLYARGSHDVVVENATFIGNGKGVGLAADEGSGQRCPKVGCSFRAQNLLIANFAAGMTADDHQNFLIEYSNAHANKQANFHAGEAVGDTKGRIRKSMTVAPEGIGRGPGRCLIYVPERSNMKRSGKGGGDIGASVLYRYVDGVLTKQPLWDPRTGEFPHGAVVAGLNDVAGESLFDLHRRLNVATPECPLPSDYGGE